MQPKPNRTLIICILGALATVTPFAIDLYLPAFSEIAEDFNTIPSRVSLSISSYFIGMAIGQMLYGPLLDRFGRKKPLYAGILVFICASIGCAQAGSVDTLIIFRFIQALGGSVAWVGAAAMVRDFFPVDESARMFSMLILIIGVSPLLAPTIGGFISTAWGWQSVFYILGGFGITILLVTIFFLPEGHVADRSVSLKPGPIIKTFLSILKHPQFYTYTFAGAFSFATLFIYVAGSPVIFMEIFKISPKVYGGIFALLSVGFIGASQLNIFLTRRYSSEKLFKFALTGQAIASLVFLTATLSGWFGLYETIAMFFIILSFLGICNPNANALALAPFTKNVGSAAALLGFSQIGIAALASSGVGLFNSQDILSVVVLIAGTCVFGFTILFIGRKRISHPVTTTGTTGNVVH
jgi:DHA1 family bicyclomycin/chloramphenicol resistance-like MFS transporter